MLPGPAHISFLISQTKDQQIKKRAFQRAFVCLNGFSALHHSLPENASVMKLPAFLKQEPERNRPSQAAKSLASQNQPVKKRSQVEKRRSKLFQVVSIIVQKPGMVSRHQKTSINRKAAANSETRVLLKNSKEKYSRPTKPENRTIW